MAKPKARRHFAWALTTALIAAPATAVGTSLQPTARTDQSEFAVAYQINPAHSGSMVFQSGFRLPLKKLWTTTITGSEVTLTYPLIADDKVFFNESPNNGNNGSTHALSLRSGSPLWSYNSGAGYIGPTYDNQTVFVQSSEGLLQALSAASGTLKWSLQLNYTGDSTPSAIDGLIYVASGQYAVNETTGNIVWYGDPANASTDGAPAYGDGGIYIPGTCFYDKLNGRSGATVWQYESCQDYGINLDGSVYRSGRAYIEDVFEGNFILNAGTGGYAGTFDCDYQRPADPPAFVAIKGQQLGVCLSHGTLSAWDAISGSTIWSFTGDGELTTPPVTVNELVFAGSRSGKIYALDAATGLQRWSARVGNPGATSFAAGEGTLIVVRSTNTSSSTVTAYAPR